MEELQAMDGPSAELQGALDSEIPEEQANLYVKMNPGAQENCGASSAVAVYIGDDELPESVWRRSSILTVFVDACKEHGAAGSGPLTDLALEDVKGWVDFTPDVDYRGEAEMLCAVIEVRPMLLCIAFCMCCLFVCDPCFSVLCLASQGAKTQRPEDHHHQAAICMQHWCSQHVIVVTEAVSYHARRKYCTPHAALSL